MYAIVHFHQILYHNRPFFTPEPSFSRDYGSFLIKTFNIFFYSVVSQFRYWYTLKDSYKDYQSVCPVSSRLNWAHHPLPRKRVWLPLWILGREKPHSLAGKEVNHFRWWTYTLVLYIAIPLRWYLFDKPINQLEARVITLWLFISEKWYKRTFKKEKVENFRLTDPVWPTYVQSSSWDIN
jgi:hypothetical protein